MNIRSGSGSGLMSLNARKYPFICCKRRSCFIARSLSSAPRAIACKYSLPSTGIASDRRYTKLVSRPNTSCQPRLISSEAAAHDAENKTEETSHDEAKQEQQPSTESEKAKPRLSKRGERFRNEFLSRIVPWEKIPVSFDNFSYYIDDDTKTLLMECAASHLKRETKFRKYGSTLRYSSNRIQLQSIAGTDLYRERLVSAVARELHVPLLKLDSSVLPPYDISQKYSTDEPAYKEDSSDSDRDYPDYHYSDTDDDSSDDDYSYSSSMPPRHKATPYVGGEVKLKKGDRVKYVGNETSIEEVKNRTLSRGTRGEVHEVNGEKVAVIFNDCRLKRTEDEKEEEGAEKTAQVVTWLEGAHTHISYDG